MKPFKSVLPFSRWLLRITLLAYLIVIHFDTFKALNFSSLQFYFAAVFIVFSALLLLGGFISESLTVVSALIIIVLSLYQMIVSFTGTITEATVWFLIPLSISFYFLSTGNKS